MSITSRAPGNAGVHWSAVAARRLRLSESAEIIRQEHRGLLWYVVRDRLGDRYYRFGPNVYMFVSLLDGKRTVEDAYRLVLHRLGDDAPTEVEVLKLLWRLHAADLLRGDVAGRTEEVVARAERADRQRWIMQLRSPLAFRVPLFDPAKILVRMAPLARAIFSLPAFLVWLTVLLIGLSQIALNWNALTNNFADRVLSYDNLFLIYLTFPLVKALHEFGHGLAMQRWRCQSHEMGIMFLVFLPIPYIDASSSAVLSRPSQRAAVGAAGLYVELFLAALASFFWAHLEPGLARALCFNVIIIAGASAILFNGNPLLKFDAYYVISDVLEIPNLASRSNYWWLYQIKRKILGIKNAKDPVEARGEGFWLAVYSPSSLIYRLFLIYAIAIFVAKKFFFFGTLLALIAIFNILILPLLRGVHFLFVSTQLKNGRSRAFLGTTGILAFLLVLFFLLPVPHRTLAQGVVWYSQGAELRPLASGYVVRFFASSGDHVKKGEMIAELHDPEIEAEIDSLSARLEALRAQYRRETANDRRKAKLTAEEIAYIRERLDAARDRMRALNFTSPTSGKLVIPRQRDHERTWLGRGSLIGHIVGGGQMVVQVVLPQADMELVTEQMRHLSVRFASNKSRTVPGLLSRMTPRATDELPSALLSTEGGGPYSLRQTEKQEAGPRTIETVFILEIALDPHAEPLFGERAYVMFDHGYSPMWQQLLRSVRQMFLREFEV